MGKNMNEDIERRDYFAAHAMQGILAGKPAMSYENIATVAYIIADSMIAQRVAPEHPEDDE
jgi:hypothetical protein